MNPIPFFVKTTSTINHAVQVIDEGAAQVAVVVDSEYKLLGIITDGDIRRAILKGISLQNKVSLIMTKSPLFLKVGATRKQALNLMSNDSIHHVPIVDDNMIVKDLFVWDNLLHRKSFKNSVIFMAGGKGERLKPLTNDCPKPMLKVKGKPMLEIILEKCLEAGFSNFYISVNYLKDQIIDYFQNGVKWGANIKYLEENEFLGTCGCLNLLPDDVSDDIIVMNGDIFTDLDLDRLIRFHLKTQSIFTVCSRTHRVRVPFAVLNSKQNSLKDFIEKPMYEYQVNAGVYALRKECIREIPSKFFNMTDLIDKLLENKHEVGVFPIHESWQDIGNPTEFSQICEN